MIEVTNKQLTGPLTAQFEITPDCNHCCWYCYIRPSNGAVRQTAPVEDGDVLAVAAELAASGIFSVILTGGEPLMRKDLLRQVVRIFRSKGVRISLNTNLTLLDEKTAQFLKDEDIQVLTSCPSADPDSFNSLTGTVNHALFEKGLRLLLDRGVHVTVNMVVTRDNKGEVIATARRIHHLGDRYFGATPMTLNMDYPRPDLSLSLEEVHQVVYDLLWIGENLEGMHIDIIEALPKCAFPPEVLKGDWPFLHRQCRAGETTVSVSPTGEVRSCGHNSRSCGNILTDGLAACWASMTDWAEGRYVPEACRTCSWLSRCKGGCRINAMTAGGRWDSMDPWAPGPIAEPPVVPAEKPVTLGKDSRIAVSRTFASRDEGDGDRLYFNRKDGTFFIVNAALSAFMEDLRSLEEDVPYAWLRKAYGAKEDAAFKEVVTFLVRKGYLLVRKAA